MRPSGTPKSSFRWIGFAPGIVAGVVAGVQVDALEGGDAGASQPLLARAGGGDGEAEDADDGGRLHAAERRGRGRRSTRRRRGPGDWRDRRAARSPPGR